MTNQEAIKWLDLIKRKGVEFDDNSEETKNLRERAIKCNEEALCMGIEALKNQKSIIEELEKIKAEIGKEFVDLQDGSEEWRSYVNDAVLSCYEIVENRIHELKGSE